MGLRTGTRDNEPQPGKQVISKNANKPSQIQRDAKQRARVERLPSKIFPDDVELPFDEKEAETEFRQKYFQTMRSFRLMSRDAVADFRHKKSQAMTKFRLRIKNELNVIHQTVKAPTLKSACLKKLDKFSYLTKGTTGIHH